MKLGKSFSGETLTVERYTLGLLITTGLGLAVALSDGVATELSENDFNATNEVFTPEETRWIVSFTSPEDSAYNTPIGLIMVLLDLVAYLSIGYFSVRIWLHVRQLSSHIPDARAHAINRQVSITLLAQALTPLVLIIGPEFYSILIVANLMGSPQGEYNVQGFFVSWLPVIDGLSALIIIRPYRMAVLRALCLAKPIQVQPVMVVASGNLPPAR